MAKYKAKLGGMQSKFCEEYIKDFHGTKAGIRAGYAKAGAAVSASQILSKPIARKYIRELLDEERERNEVDADKVVQELYSIGLFNIKDFHPVLKAVGNLDKLLDGISREAAACIASVKEKTTTTKKGNRFRSVEITMHPKVKALELLGKRFALFTENVHHTVEDNRAWTIDDLDLDLVTKKKLLSAIRKAETKLAKKRKD